MGEYVIEKELLQDAQSKKAPDFLLCGKLPEGTVKRSGQKTATQQNPGKGKIIHCLLPGFSVLRKEDYGGLFMDFTHIFMILGRHFVDDLTYFLLLAKLKM